MKKLQRNLLNTLLALVLAFANPAFMSTAAASDMYDDYGAPSGDAMLFDGFFVRPSMLVATAVGVVMFVVTLPFSALGGNVDETGKALVADPVKYTFARPLGEM